MKVPDGTTSRETTLPANRRAGLTSGSAARSRHARAPSGQSLVEFALIFPFLMMLVLAIADFSRWYSTAVAIESAAREAADYGAFTTSNWMGDPVDPTSNSAKTIATMKTLACTAASSLSGYEGDVVGTPDMSCTNPDVEDPSAIVLTGSDCSNNAAVPCQLNVTLNYRFDLFIPVPMLSPSIQFARSSSFAIAPFPQS